MNLRQIQTFYNKAFSNGELITFKSINPTTGVYTDFAGIPVVTEREFGAYFVGEINTATVNLLLLAQALTNVTAPAPKKGDSVLFRNQLFTLSGVDGVTYSFEGTVLAYKLIMGD